MSDNTFTPYAAHNLVNAALKENGFDTVIPPQMMYNYTTGRVAKGKVPFIDIDPNGGLVRSSFDTWLEGYISRKVAASTKVQEELDTPIEGLELEVTE